MPLERVLLNLVATNYREVSYELAMTGSHFSFERAVRQDEGIGYEIKSHNASICRRAHVALRSP